MTPTQPTPGSAAPIALPLPQRVVPPADEQDAMREQLEYIFEMVHQGVCRCPECEKYKALRTILLETTFKATDLKAAKANG